LPLGIPASDIKTILVEAPASDRGLHGKAASDIDLGYKIDVYAAGRCGPALQIQRTGQNDRRHPFLPADASASDAGHVGK
jgi:hypothetical protein